MEQSVISWQAKNRRAFLLDRPGHRIFIGGPMPPQVRVFSIVRSFCCYALLGVFIAIWSCGCTGIESTGTSQDLWGVWGIHSNDVWVVGDSGTILKWDGSSWTTQASGTTRSLFAVRGVDTNNVWAVGEDGTILKW